MLLAVSLSVFCPSPTRTVLNVKRTRRISNPHCVIHTLAEAERLEPGDILVCPTTAPPWTPLFAIAGAVVTDSGGVLSHAAICAREYAIGRVVGTMIGTRAIPDGATITVDAGVGTVRIGS